MILRHLTHVLALFLACAVALASASTIPSNTTPVNVPRARPTYVAHAADALVCRPFGECEPCPEDELDQPFCQPFGNRRLLHCIPESAQDNPYETDDGSQQPGEVPAWEACGRVVKKEQRDFYEFVTANVLFLVVAISIYAVRTSTLAAAQYRQLAARIGIPSGGWRV